jgi:competence protein ComEC
MTSSKIFLYFCISFIIGIFINSIFFISQPLLLGFLILGILLISVFWRYKKLVVIGFCIIFLVFGVWRHQSFLFKIENSSIKKLIEKEVTLTGLVEKEPSQGEKILKLEIKIEKLPESQSLAKGEKVIVTTWRYPEYEYGDKLKIKGKLEEPPEFEGFNYKDYLVKDGILAQMSFPEIELIEKNRGNFLKKTLISFKRKLEESLNSLLSRPHSAILEALLFGKEENIPRSLKEKLNKTGTRHLTAISGMNLTIISVLLLNFLLFLGLWRQQAFYLSVVLIIFYVLMTGSPASVVRAAIMVILFLTAQYFGRYSSGLRAIIFAATFMLFQNPLLLTKDVGFQLSFLATMGLVHLQPILSEWFQKIPNFSFLQLRNNLSTTISAQIFTLPILIYNFGYIPIFSPITNILILPLIPSITILGFIFAFLGIFWQSLAQILSWFAWLGLSFVLKVVEIFSKIPFSFLSIKNVHWIFLIISYLVLAIIVFRLQEARKLKFLKY